MKDTSPPILSIWSGLPAPECCLANKSPARKSSERLQSALEETLSRRLTGLGSTIYQIDWKPHVTPLGRTISRQRALARRTSGKEPISEPSPTNGWNTPRATDGSNGGPNEANGALASDAALAGWATASARDWKDSAGMATEAVNPDGSSRVRLDQLPRQAQLAKDGPARLTASGELLTGSSAGMNGGGPLNPETSRWLMGYPAEWGFCGATAMQSIPSKRRSSSKRSSKPSKTPSAPLPVNRFLILALMD